jgi:hypothetical protein
MPSTVPRSSSIPSRHYQHQAAALLAYQRGITRKLDGIAVTLLGGNDDGALHLLAVPLLVGEPQVGRVGQFPTGFIGWPALFQIALDQVAQSNVPTDIGQIGVQLARLVENIEGFVDQAGVFQSNAEVVDHAGIGRIEFHRPPEHLDRFLVLSRVLESITEVAQGLGILGVAFQRAPVAGNRRIQFAFLAQGNAQIVEGRHITRGQRQCLVISGDGGLQVTLVLGFDCGVEKSLGVSGDFRAPFRQFWLFRHNPRPRKLKPCIAALCAR